MIPQQEEPVIAPSTEMATGTEEGKALHVRRPGEAPVKLEYLIIEKPLPPSSEEEKKRKFDEQEQGEDQEEKNKNKKSKSFHNRTREAIKKNKKEKASASSEGDEQKEEKESVRPTDETNFLDMEIVKTLRKKTYNFQKADEVTNHVEQFSKQESNTRSKLSPDEILFRQRQQQIVRQKMIERGETIDESKFENFLQYKETKYHPTEIKKVDFKGKTYLAPLTTVGNLPFRRICKDFGCEITIGEMALSHAILKGERGDISLLRRHESEKIFGVQLAGRDVPTMTRMAQLIDDQFPNIDFVDINCGCPVNSLCSQGMGSGLMEKRTKLTGMVRGMKEILHVPLSVKMRTGTKTGKNIAHKLFADLCECGVDALTIHGRSKEMRYTKEPDYKYIYDCAAVVNNYSERTGRKVYTVGNGDIFSYQEWYEHIDKVDSLMIGRGALIKPWLFREIETQQTLDISSSERLEILKTFVKYGLDHYGGDEIGVGKTRRFLLEWLSFLHRYIPVGLLERLPQRMNERPPLYKGRNELETLMASPNSNDWLKLTELAGLPKVGDDYVFLPKHKSNSYEDSING